MLGLVVGSELGYGRVMSRDPNAIVSVRVRMTQALRAQLTAEGEAAGRSFNAEVLYRLGETLGDRWKEYVAELALRERAEREWMEKARNDPKVQEQLRELIKGMKRKDGLTHEEWLARKGKKP
jgi:hypothetical protein